MCRRQIPGPSPWTAVAVGELPDSLKACGRTFDQYQSLVGVACSPGIGWRPWLSATGVALRARLQRERRHNRPGTIGPCAAHVLSFALYSPRVSATQDYPLRRCGRGGYLSALKAPGRPKVDILREPRARLGSCRSALLVKILRKAEGES